VSPDSTRVFVTGLCGGIVTISYDASSGTQLWVAHYGSGDGWSLGVSPDGTKVFITGDNGGDFATIAYDASSGTQLWIADYNGPANGLDFGRSLGVSPDGSKVFVTGESAGLWVDYATVAYEAATGTMLWVERYSGSNTRDTPTSLGVTPDGSKVVVTGTSSDVDFDENDYATVTYDASSGTQLWARLYTGPLAGSPKRGAFAPSLAVSPDASSVFVTGANSPRYSNSDYATVAYDASSGSILWAERYNGPGNNTDIARAVGVSPDGSKVFVTGESSGLGCCRDYATVAYSTR
jgi:hypothetical protein